MSIDKASTITRRSFKGVSLFVFLVIAFTIVGCVDAPSYLASKRLGNYAYQSYYDTETVFDKNYEINKEQTAYVGNAIIKVSEYTETRWYKKGYVFNKRFHLNIPELNAKFRIDDDDIFLKAGAIDLDNQRLTLYTIPYLDPIALMVDKDDNFILKIAAAGNEIYDATIDKADIKFEYKKVPSSTRKPTKTKQSSYEIIYTGKNDNSITMVYREYTGDDMARPAFSQNLLYSPKQKQIRFKDIIINIISADNEKIVYKVVAD
ncbi:hypothetical protein [Campylobacter sp. 19-13652]|uniref:hypothetical protein n=1 Tax=Campylobacter sp. 19-13652 TaxID=2840180 RepID=UPI001C7869CC|nr:hypothetical protein [Campylobacter sp. 19-13652]BCX79270.1 hypothetical protein LBC_07320 [Campylobacter sp. 19-13652]